MSTELTASVIPTAIPPTPKLVPVFFFNLKIANEPEAIFGDKATDTELTLARVINGTITTVPNEIGEFDVADITGFDDLTVKGSTATATLDCKLYGRTKNGSGVVIRYPGVVQMAKVTTDVFSKQSKGHGFDEGFVTCNPSFVFDSQVEDKYRWVLKENFISKGRFIRDAEDGLYVQYYTYALRY